MRNHKVLTTLAVMALWLTVGALAASQRGYFGTRCVAMRATFLVVVAGPANYVGLPTQRTKSTFHFWHDDVYCD